MSDVKTRQVSSVSDLRSIVNALNKGNERELMLPNARVTRLETYVAGPDRRGEISEGLPDELDAFAGNVVYGGEERRKQEVEKELYNGDVFITPRGSTGRFSIGAEFNKLGVHPIGNWKLCGKNGSSYATIASKQGNIRLYVNG